MKINGRGQHRRQLGRPFARIWGGFALASTGDGLIYGAVPLLAVLVNPHPLAVSAVVAADTLPWLIFALPAGVLADRFERGGVAAFANVLRATAVLATAVLIVTGRMNLPLLLLAVLANAAGRAIYYSSLQAMIPDLVSSGALERANGLLTGTESGTEHLAGPIVGSSVFALSPAAPFFADAIALIASCIPFVRVRSKPAAPTEEESTSMWQGVRLLLSDRRLRVLLIVVASLAFLQGMEGGVLVLLATKVWGVSEGAYGVFLATVAVGNIIGSAMADGQVRRFGSAWTIVGWAIVSGVAYLLMAAAHGWLIAGIAYMFVGIAVTVISVVAISLRQRLTPPGLMGRVGGAWRGLVWGAAPVGALVAGSVATLGGLRMPLVIAGTLQCLVALAFARPLLKSVGPEAAADAEPAGHSGGHRASS
jgi:Na+/melibiose symporter-like transporter